MIGKSFFSSVLISFMEFDYTKSKMSTLSSQMVGLVTMKQLLEVPGPGQHGKGGVEFILIAQTRG